LEDRAPAPLAVPPDALDKPLERTDYLSEQSAGDRLACR
jgi:hypothetical protein